jgi:hypothetical protein
MESMDMIPYLAGGLALLITGLSVKAIKGIRNANDEESKRFYEARQNLVATFEGLPQDARPPCRRGIKWNGIFIC